MTCYPTIIHMTRLRFLVRVLLVAWCFSPAAWAANAPVSASNAVSRSSLKTRPCHILFIGNSYTYVNDLPSVVRAMAVSAGLPQPAIASHTAGGYTLVEHALNPQALALIDRGPTNGVSWDVVVLQEQSQTPAMAEEIAPVRRILLAGITNLCLRIKQHHPQARIILYQTWARHAELWAKPNNGLKGMGGGPAEMQSRQRKWSENAARTAAKAAAVPISLARVGDLWEFNYQDAKPLRLHAVDGSHPNPAGTYLAGLVLLATIYDVSPLHVTYAGGVVPADALRLRKLAADHALTLSQIVTP
jgi:hypothetical protein